MDTFTDPKWSKELQRFITVKPQFLFWGNIYDVYPMSVDSNIVTYRLIDYFVQLLKNQQYSLVINFEPIYGLSLLYGQSEVLQEIIGETIEPNKNFPCTLTKAADIIEKIIINKRASAAIIINFGSRLPDIAKQDIEEFYYRMFRQCQFAESRLLDNSTFPKYNPLIWLFDKENDIPAWYTFNNPKIKNISIPKPDYLVRKVVIEALSKNIPGYTEMELGKRNDCLSLFIDQTSNLHANEIISIVSLIKREGLNFSEISEAIRRYKLGIVENPWQKLDPIKIEHADEILSKRVKGQHKAIQKASDLIKRSFYNLSGSQYSKYSNRPKGILFFAGPTGVGKTELAKAITELIFGSETSYIRFDMTEFKQEHADQRLIGSPPGYVGYDIGGELTNSIKQNPFSVLLFDEIEKAHPRILDIFMQILDDGRLTSGRGETVYFSESFIIFTSNLGIYELTQSGEKIQRVSADLEYPEIESRIIGAIDDFFKYKISRPEILNRIGENFIVFDYIRPNTAKEIFDKMIGSVIEKVGESHKIKLDISEPARDLLQKQSCKDLSMGGRGIGNQIEEIFINPLSRALFKLNAKEGMCYTVKDIIEKPDGRELILEKTEVKV